MKDYRELLSKIRGSHRIVKKEAVGFTMAVQADLPTLAENDAEFLSVIDTKIDTAKATIANALDELRDDIKRKVGGK